MHPIRILLVEDEPDNRFLAETALSMAGHTVVCCQHGAEAVDRCVHHAEAYDLVVMDLLMPEMDGFEATRRLRAHAGTAAVPILACSALASDAERQAAQAAGCDHFLGKPYVRAELLRAIEITVATAGRRAPQAPETPA